MRGKALVLHQEGDVTALQSRQQRAELLRQQLHVIDLRHGAARPQRVTAAAHRASPPAAAAPDSPAAPDY